MVSFEFRTQEASITPWESKHTRRHDAVKETKRLETTNPYKTENERSTNIFCSEPSKEIG